MNKDLFNKVKEIGLPLGKYAIFGSGPMGIRELRECRDLDIIVTEDIYNIYKNNSGWELKKCDKSEYLEKDNIELWKNWSPSDWNINQLIKNAEIIDDLPFVRLEEVLRWKKILGREKDLEDIKIIERYLKNEN